MNIIFEIIVLILLVIIIVGAYAVLDIVIFDCLVTNKIRRKLGIKDL